MPEALDPFPLLRALHERSIRLHTDLGRLDVMQWLSGIKFDDPYGALDREAIESKIDDLPVRVCGLDHLRAMKRAAGRPRDLEDLKGLGED